MGKTVRKMVTFREWDKKTMHPESTAVGFYLETTEREKLVGPCIVVFTDGMQYLTDFYLDETGMRVILPKYHRRPKWFASLVFLSPED